MNLYRWSSVCFESGFVDGASVIKMSILCKRGTCCDRINGENRDKSLLVIGDVEAWDFKLKLYGNSQFHRVFLLLIFEAYTRFNRCYLSRSLIPHSYYICVEYLSISVSNTMYSTDIWMMLFMPNLQHELNISFNCLEEEIILSVFDLLLNFTCLDLSLHSKFGKKKKMWFCFANSFNCSSFKNRFDWNETPKS